MTTVQKTSAFVIVPSVIKAYCTFQKSVKARSPAASFRNIILRRIKLLLAAKKSTFFLCFCFYPKLKIDQNV